MADIDPIDQWAYKHGVAPLDWAIKRVQTELEVFHDVQRSRAEDPATYPGYVLALTDEALARAIVGRLLDCGWTPPTHDQLQEDAGA